MISEVQNHKTARAKMTAGVKSEPSLTRLDSKSEFLQNRIRLVICVRDIKFRNNIRDNDVS